MAIKEKIFADTHKFLSRVMCELSEDFLMEFYANKKTYVRK
jgi:hypothetical protein